MSSDASSMYAGTDVLAPEGELCSYATRFPKFKRGKDTKEDVKRDQFRQCSMKIIDFLLRQPNASVDIWTSIESDVLSEKKSEASSSSLLALPAPSPVKSAKTFGRVDFELKAAVYLSLPDAPEKSVLDLVHDKDAMAIGDMLEMHFHVAKHDKVPDIANGPHIFVQMMKYRNHEVGNRVAGWFAACIGSDGQVNWNGKPLFGFTWSDAGRLLRCQHTSGDWAENIPEDCFITQKFTLLDPCSDEQARFLLDPIVEVGGHYVRHLFRKNKGPKAFRLDKAGAHMRALAEQAQAAISDKVQELKSLVDTSADVNLGSRQKRLREEALQKARQAIVARPKKMRSLIFESNQTAYPTDKEEDA